MRTARYLGGIIACVCLAAFINQLRRREEKQECLRSLQYVGSAIRNYEDLKGLFPPAQSDGHSWRIRIVPYLFASSLYESYDFDRSWDAPSNLDLHFRTLPVKTAGPNEPHGIPYPYSRNIDDKDISATRFLMFVGENAFGSPLASRSRSEMTDDPETILVAGQTFRNDIHWLCPKDFDADDLSELRNSMFADSRHNPAVVFLDGSVFRMRDTITDHSLRALLSINGAEIIKREELISSGVLYK